VHDLTAENVDDCVMAAAHFAPEPVAARFERRLRELLACGAATGLVLDVPLDQRRSCRAAAAWVFVDEARHQQFHDVRPPQLDAWIVDEVLEPGAGVLSRDEVARANAGDGLNMFVLFFRGDDRPLTESDHGRVVHEMMAHVFPQLTGYNLRSLTARARHHSQAISAVQAGTTLLHPSELPPAPAPAVLPNSVLVHADRDSVPFASWVAGAFVWRKPVVGFSAAEQRTLSLALRGYRDARIAEACGVSASTIKKRWDSIFARVAAAVPTLFGDAADSPLGRRGPEKRTTLLSYLSRHPEELRPYQL